MKIRILGSAPGMPILGKNHACVWVNSNNKSILFDCGEGTSQQLMKFKLDKDEIDAIVISHLHPDHLIGIYMVLLMFYLKGRSKELRIYLPESEEQFRRSLPLFYLFPEKFPFKITIKNITQLELNWIEPVESDHLYGYKEIIESNGLFNEMRSYSFVISEQNNKMIYTSDLFSLDFLKAKIQKAQLIILDSVHTSYQQLVDVFNNNDIRIIINHGLSDEVRKFIAEIPEDKYEFADEDQEIIL